MKFGKTAIAIVSIAAIGAATAGYFHMEKQKHLSSASYALSQAKLAITSKDKALFEKHVDTHKVALSILANMLKESNQQTKETDNLLESVGTQLSNKLGKRFAAFVQPELSKNLQTQMTSFVEAGSFGDDIDLSRLYGGKPMLQNLWEELKGEEIVFGEFTNVQQQETTASAELAFEKPVLEFSSALKFDLEKEGESWKVVGINNLAEKLSEISEKRAAVIAKQNTQTQERLNAAISVVSVEKSAGVSQWGVGKGLLLRAAFENTSEKNIQSFHATINFKDETGETIKQTDISDTDLLMSASVAEKSWPMGINPLSQADNFIYDATDASLTIQIDLKAITFEDGEKLELISIE